ncbi:MAG: hypothetical protein M1815_002429 [Lichina confinis]|nr:MAG: hypothetical protein M1815_002429 [Lichina confinis]
MCQMNMLFTWDTTNLCIVFRQWRITGAASLVFSLLAVAALTAGYEFVREMSRQYEARQTLRDSKGQPHDENRESSSLLRPERDGKTGPSAGRLGRALFYGVQVFYSLFIMLLFMTYNGWIMLSVTVGAFTGYLIWGKSSSTRSAACH